MRILKTFSLFLFVGMIFSKASDRSPIFLPNAQEQTPRESVCCAGYDSHGICTNWVNC